MAVGEISESTRMAEQKAVLDGFLESAAEIIVAQSRPELALREAKGMLARKVLEVTRVADDYLGRRSQQI